jgi:16S rRNA (cytosine967-C5)-methyltransferase
VLAAEEILGRWMAERDSTPLDRLVQIELRARRYLNSSERRWAGDAVFGAVRYWRHHDASLARAGRADSARERIALWLRESGDAGLSAPPDGAAGRDEPERYLRETLSFPDAMAEALEELLGPEAIDAAEGLNGPAPTTLRVNALRSTRRQVLDSLPGSSPTRVSPWGVDIPSRVNLHDVPSFLAGWFEVQEEASQLIALLTDAEPGQTVVDVGAGAGGKCLALAAMMANEGVVVAIDADSDRLDRLEKRAARAGARIVRRLAISVDAQGAWQLSATKQRRVDKLAATADCVLVDAPCTGSGVLRRSPDAKWRVSDLADFARLQLSLIEQSAPFVAPGGCLVYATCAFERVQNEAVVETFLRSEAGAAFELTPAVPRLERAIGRCAFADDPQGEPRAALLQTLAAGPYLRTWPHRHNMDAFFAACLIRKSG